MLQWITDYLRGMHNMLEEADQSADPRVKMAALRVIERQSMTIRQLEFDQSDAMPVSEAVELIRATPPERPSQFAEETRTRRRERYGSTGA